MEGGSVTPLEGLVESVLICLKPLHPKGVGGLWHAFKLDGTWGVVVIGTGEIQMGGADGWWLFGCRQDVSHM
jgi:hypothetical protein